MEPDGEVKRLLRFAASSRLAAVLIASVAAFSLAGVVFPQRAVFATDVPAWVSSFGLDRVFISGPFLVVVALLGVNVTACTILRVMRRVRRRTRVPTSAPAGAVVACTSSTPEAAIAGAARTLRGWRLSHADGRTALRADSGGVGFVGSVVEHAGIVVLMIGGLVSALTSFTGTMILTEGQTLPDAPASYASVELMPRIGPAFGDFSVGLDSLAFRYSGDTVTDAAARMTVTDASGVRTRLARVNEPLLVQGKSFLLLSAGYAVEMRVEGARGAVLADSVVNLGKAEPAGYSDDIPIAGDSLHVLAVPDASAPAGAPAARRLEITAPALFVTSPGGAPTRLLRGETARVGGYTVTFRGLRRWNKFLVRGDGGRGLVYLAFGMLVLGAAVRMALPDRHLAVVATPSAGGSQVAIWGKSTFGPAGVRLAIQAVLRSIGDDGSAT